MTLAPTSMGSQGIGHDLATEQCILNREVGGNHLPGGRRSKDDLRQLVVSMSGASQPPKRG